MCVGSATLVTTKFPINSKTFERRTTSTSQTLSYRLISYPCIEKRIEEIPEGEFRKGKGRRGRDTFVRLASCINKLKAYPARQNTIDDYAWPLQIFSLCLFASHLALTSYIDRIKDRGILATRSRTVSAKGRLLKCIGCFVSGTQTDNQTLLGFDLLLRDNSMSIRKDVFKLSDVLLMNEETVYTPFHMVLKYKIII